MKAIASPIEKNVYILSKPDGIDDYEEFMTWLTDSGIQYKIASNIIWFADEESELMFVMRWT